MAGNKWTQLERWLAQELEWSAAHRDNQTPGSSQRFAWEQAIITLTDVMEKMDEIDHSGDRLPQGE